MASPPPLRTGPPFYAPRPEQVELCRRAACDGDLDQVKAQLQQLLYHTHVPSIYHQPQPAWVFGSLREAISRDDVKMVQFLLEAKVATKLPAEVAVRCRAFKVLELFLQLGWDINQPRARNNPSVLRY